jgi:hypothetical protein
MSFAGLILLSALAACNKTPTSAAGCIGDIPVTMTASTSNSSVPVFGWMPQCGITDLTVTTVPGPGAAATVVWQVTAPETMKMAPAITFGAAPRNATTRVAPHALVAGVTYRVTISTTVGGDAIAANGDRTFVQ